MAATSQFEQRQIYQQQPFAPVQPQFGYVPYGQPTTDSRYYTPAPQPGTVPQQGCYFPQSQPVQQAYVQPTQFTQQSFEPQMQPSVNRVQIFEQEPGYLTQLPQEAPPRYSFDTTTPSCYTAPKSS